MSVFENFKGECKFDEETISKITNFLPMEISEILKKYGCGSILNGYLRIINPFEYQEVIKDTYFDIPLYEEAINKYGQLGYEECFGFVPLLLMGGKKDVEHLVKVNEKVRIELITRLVGRIE